MRLTDREFFEQHIDLSIPALAPIKSLAESGDFEKCRKIFSGYVKSTVDPERFFETRADKGIITLSDELLEKADRACRHYMVSCSIAYDFDNQKVDWEFNPTHNAYKEWPWQLNRHYEFTALAEAGRATSDSKYAKACEDLFESWHSQMEAPNGETAFQTVGWRTIECGIRQGLVWPFVFHTFCRDFSDDTIVNWCKSVYEHGVRLENDYTSNNWLIMEMNGLIHTAVLNPWLKACKRWKKLALELLEREVDSQVYPDGVQTEISTDYQAVIIRNYTRVIRLCKVYGIEISSHMYEMIEKTIMFYVRLMMPDGRSPAINDGTFACVKNIVEPEMDLFKSNKVFGNITENKEPDIENSYV